MRFPSTDGEIEGYLAVPTPAVSGAGPWPGVVVVHDALGMSDDIRSIAERFATAGYLAVVPNLYSRGGFLRCVRAVFGQLAAGSGQAFDDIDAARKLLADRDDCTGRVGVAGFCLGGGFALLAGPRGFQASAPYYGAVPKDTSVLRRSCPVVASFGGRDRTLRGAAAKLESALTELGVPHDVKEYPDAVHSFANRMPLGPFAPLARVVGFGYHHDSAEDAWRRVLGFFAEHLR
ncbi:carboxymethylenebutenolidase [Gandjariella thermophila]|uniref:Carboxymethylenebutenolidase n=1 Tax=Gandjariella thermophila TaxID=1931992 RepID=A0A4D4J5V1_9PSEU|nr:carboxymethylenebutenolidase [Gandjariella thermophila]